MYWDPAWDRIPFPTIVRDFQSVISKEIKAQMLERKAGFRMPCWLV